MKSPKMRERYGFLARQPDSHSPAHSTPCLIPFVLRLIHNQVTTSGDGLGENSRTWKQGPGPPRFPTPPPFEELGGDWVISKRG